MTDLMTETTEGQLFLELEDFKIDTAGWSVETLESGTRVKINAKGDVTELLEGEFAGYQYFSWDAAIRETARAGKRMPTYDEWSKIIRAINPELDPEGSWQSDISVREALCLNFAGYRLFTSAEYVHQGDKGYYWTASYSSLYGYLLSVSKGMIGPAFQGMRAYGFSVRCLKD